MSLQFLKELAERALKTFCQSLAAILGVGAIDLLSVPWRGALLGAAIAAGLSVLTSIGSSLRGDPATPSLVLPEDDA